jgi:uncharacterized protein YecE (DUF72 family)
LDGLGLAIEFRHYSWNHPDTPAWLAEIGADPVSVDVPDLPGLFPRGLVASGPNLYVRLHSRRAENWYAPDKDRYDYDYSDTEMREWIDALDAAEGASRALVLFNNCHRSQAAVNARRMRTLFEQSATGHTVVAPFAPPVPVQRSLF